MNWENDYLNLVEQVIATGFQSKSRAGDTYSLQGESLKIPLDQGFPLLTTRKMFPAGVIGELAAFVRGAEDLATYEKYGCNYWGDNAANWVANEGKPRAEWQVGRVYGVQWTNWQPSRYRPQPKPKLREGLPATALGIANGAGSGNELGLRQVWNNMLYRCYSPSSEKYPLYGARGVYVHDSWLEFAQFSTDAKQLPGWDPITGNAGLQLDKDLLGDGFCYGPSTCQWVSPKENHYGRHVRYTVEKEGLQYTFENASQFCMEHNCEPSQFSRMLNKVKHRKTSNGFSLVSAEVLSEGTSTPINQLANVINGIKKDPYSRRHLVTAWSPSELDLGALPPCHVMFQFYVRRDELHCMVMMRSVDLCVGLPSDIILYALLTNLVAKDTGLKPKSLTFFFGNTHVYANHVDLFLTGQKDIEPKESPTLLLAPGCTTLDFVPSDVQILDYQHGPVIKYPFNA